MKRSSMKRRNLVILERKYKGTIIKTAHDKLEWAKLEDFHRYNFLPGDNPLIDKLKQEL